MRGNRGERHLAGLGTRLGGLKQGTLGGRVLFGLSMGCLVEIDSTEGFCPWAGLFGTYSGGVVKM